MSHACILPHLLELTARNEKKNDYLNLMDTNSIVYLYSYWMNFEKTVVAVMLPAARLL